MDKGLDCFENEHENQPKKKKVRLLVSRNSSNKAKSNYCMFITKNPATQFFYSFFY